MQSAKERQELDTFLAKVDNFGDIIKGMISGDVETQQEAMKRADSQLENLKNDEKIGFNRTVINKNAYAEDENAIPGPTFTDQHTSQEAFLSALEADSQKRAEARKERNQKASILKDRGNEAFKSGDYNTAIKLYTEATTVAKDMEALYTNRAAAFMKQERYQDAIDDCDFALMIDEKWVKAHVFKGRSLQKLKQFDDASIEFKKILKIDEKKFKLVEGYIKEVEADRHEHELEKTTKIQLENEELEAKSISKVIGTIRSRLSDEKSCADWSGGLMYYAGGFRVLQTKLANDEARTLFRTQGGFKMFSDKGSVNKCLTCRLSGSHEFLSHASELVSAAVCLFTAACLHSPANVKALLIEPNIPEILLSFLEWSDDQVKRDTIAFFHELSLDDDNRSLLYGSLDCKRLTVLLLKPNTRKADANSSAAATLCNLSLDKKFKNLVQHDFDGFLLPMFQDYLEEVGKESYEALTLRMRFLVQLVDNFLIASVISSNEEFKDDCVKSLGRCVVCFKNGLSNPCAMEELLRLIAVMLSNNQKESFCRQITSCLCPAIRAKDVELLTKVITVLSLTMGKFMGCVDVMLSEGGSSGIKQIYKLMKQNDLRLKTLALKILCCIGQYDSNRLRAFIKLDKGYETISEMLHDDQSDAAKVNQGHVALLLGYLANVPGALDAFTKNDMEGSIVRQLLVLCRDSKSKQARANSAIALGKLAKADMRFLENLRKYDGINILARNKPIVELLN
ncbi:tetratricopeptide repeat protein 12-like isoform X2 [Clavelina lepadiformis]|uniref:tetratricopeptide repeat protein 12-like isoform X2 n=1 Tax=Clavelina lepadiformis TaxID=159417 RepID=UPI0040420D79